MEARHYHNYLFFSVAPEFYQLLVAEQSIIKEEFLGHIKEFREGKKERALVIDCYATLGLKAGTTFMLWCRGTQPHHAQDMLRDLFRTKLGKYLSVSYAYFGIVRNSQYSGRTGKPEQSIENFTDRLPYLVVYPFTKTHDWHALPFEERRRVMGGHVKVGLSHPAIRQCLLYSYGVDDYEFVVSYEMKMLEEFQDLVIEMRGTEGRKFTWKDTPTFTCIYKTAEELAAWL